MGLVACTVMGAHVLRWGLSPCPLQAVILPAVLGEQTEQMEALWKLLDIDSSGED